ncbi:MAG: c-type cytochrome [Myxococcales bacterium]
MRLCGFVAVTALAGCTGKYVRATVATPIEATPQRLARGGYLVNQVCACGFCHSGREHGDILTETERADEFLGGGNVYDDTAAGLSIWIPNITRDAATGVGTWSDDELLRALRDGVRPDGRFLFPLMPCDHYQHLSDDDARAVVAYVHAAPPVRQERPRQPLRLGPLYHLLFETFGVQMHRPAHDVPPPAPDAVSRGRYLAEMAACTYCHSAGARGPRRAGDPLYMAGGERPFTDPAVGKVWPSNLTPDAETGIGRYSAAQIEAALRNGLRLDGKRMAPPMSNLIPHYSGLTDCDLDALVAFLKSLPPVRHAVPQRQLVPALASTLDVAPPR